MNQTAPQAAPIEKQPGIASRTAAADKKPGEFAPIPLAPVNKLVTSMVITRANGSVETSPVILRAGDSVAIDGKTVLSLALVATKG